MKNILIWLLCVKFNRMSERQQALDQAYVDYTAEGKHDKAREAFHEICYLAYLKRRIVARLTFFYNLDISFDRDYLGCVYITETSKFFHALSDEEQDYVYTVLSEMI